MKKVVPRVTSPFAEHAEGFFYSREQRAKWVCLHAHLATAARVKYPTALQRCKFDAPLLAAGLLTAEADGFFAVKGGLHIPLCLIPSASDFTASIKRFYSKSQKRRLKP
ncbi:hypothetical protein D3Z50_13535 [Clostridiaceae bacterium]|nr:hypothetical protein [Clostridiaceae bacterium]